MGKNARGVFETALSSLFLTTAFWADNGKAPPLARKGFYLTKSFTIKTPFCSDAYDAPQCLKMLLILYASSIVMEIL